MTRARLRCELRISDLATHDPHQVALPLGQCTLGLQRILEAAHADHRQLDRPAQRGRDEHRVARRYVHRGLDHEQRGCGHTDRGVDVVDVTARLDHAGHLDGILDRGAALDEFVTAQPHAQRQVGPDRGAHRGHDLEQQPRPPLQRAAVLVGTTVGRRGKEPAHDRGVRALQLDAVEAPLGAVRRHCGIGIHDLGDLVVVDRLGDLTEQRVGHCGGSPHRQPRVHRGGLAPVVVDLGEYGHPVAVHRVGDPAVTGNHVAVEAVYQLLVGPVRGVGGVLLGDYQSRAAGGALGVVGGVLVGGKTVVRVVGEVRGEDDPVAHRDGSELCG